MGILDMWFNRSPGVAKQEPSQLAPSQIVKTGKESRLTNITQTQNTYNYYTDHKFYFHASLYSENNSELLPNEELKIGGVYYVLVNVIPNQSSGYK